MSLRLQIYKRGNASMIGSFTPLDRLVQSEARVHVMHSEPRAHMPPIASATDWSNLMIACIDWHSAMALKHQCCPAANQLVGSPVAGAKLSLDALDRNY